MALITAASYKKKKKTCVKYLEQIVLFAATDGHPISENIFGKKNLKKYLTLIGCTANNLISTICS